MAIIFDALWLGFIGLAAYRAWRFFTKRPTVDPARPPDIGDFAPPSQPGQRPDGAGELSQTPQPPKGGGA